MFPPSFICLSASSYIQFVTLAVTRTIYKNVPRSLALTRRDATVLEIEAATFVGERERPEEIFLRSAR